MQATKPKNLSLLAKLNWRYRMEKDKYWARVLSIKYRNPKRSGSNVWVGMKCGGNIFAQGIKWKVGANSNLNFWHNNWLSTGMLEA